MADGRKGQSEDNPQQGNLLNELETMYKKVSEEKPGDPGILKDSPPGNDFQTEPAQLLSPADRSSRSKKGSANLAKFFLYSVPIVLIAAFALFIWPTPYQYGALKQGGRIYLVKTNRLTNFKSYFYGGKWMNSPLPDASGLRLPDPLSVTSPGDVPMQIPEPPAAAQKPDAAPSAAQKMDPSLTTAKVQEAIKTPAKEPDRPVKKEIKPEPKMQVPIKPDTASQGPMKEEPARAAVQEKSVQAKAEPILKNTATKLTAKKKPYAVQIRAFQSRGEMKKFFAAHQDERDLHWARVKTGKGTWYRVFIGRFGGQEEAKIYIRKNQIEAAYPGSFVQKIN